MEVKVINKSQNDLPRYQTLHAAGIDVMANLEEPEKLAPMERKLIGSGLFVEIPPGYEIQVRPRSGLALKYGITVLNTPGTIDADYRGEIKVLLINFGQEDFTIHHGDRIAQLVLAKHEVIEWQLSADLSESERGSGGYGSTGK